MNTDPVVVLHRRFPGLVFWFGARTGAWWAIVPPPAGWRLIEAADPDQLTQAVIKSQSWPWPSPREGARWTLGEGLYR
ncbi:hypothetical protein [Actinoallomurus sp. NPDC052274]|uniref:hypothetical protein n=1 Tax=Actinoallomurus sp. NPDC052274 TaxID=3155420 RepID=UPI003436E92A